jgi:RHS repeat-associated protein
MSALARWFVLLGIALAAAAANAQTTLSVSPSSVPVTGSVTATWSGIATPTGTDWIGLYTPGAANTSYLSYRYTNGQASGSLPFTIPSNIAPGTYQLRLLANNGYTVLATSQNFTVTAINVTLTASPASVLAGGAVTAAWSGIPAPQANDWIGLFTPGAGNSAYLSWRYTDGTASGSVPFTIPAATGPGTYHLRVFISTGHAATSNSFTVSATLSGMVTFNGSPLAGVALAASNGGSCTSSNSLGNYSCTVPPGWSGSITPSLSGYAFTPASRTYSNVTAHQSAQNFTATLAYQLSGTVTAGGSPLAGVAFAATNGATCTSSNASGQYSCTVAHGWSGSVTPSLSGHAFTPASRSYSDVTSALTAQNYAASAVYQVSGAVTLNGSPLAGVAFAATNGGSCTSSSASGQYSCTVPPGWSGSVTPSLSGQVFAPASRSYSNVTANQTAQDYAGTVVHQLSGTVTLNGVALANVAFAAPGGGSCTSSNAWGQYACAVPPGWSGSVTPSASGYSFTPASRSYSSVASSQTAQDYSATLVTASTPMFYIHVDHLNTPRLVANQQGQAVWRWDQQEPFGVTVPDENPSGLGAFEFPLRFPGQYADKETNLFYNYFRDYNASIGGYKQSDPVGLEGGLNTYAYVHGNPLKFRDPQGLWAQVVIGIGVRVIGGRVAANAIASSLQGALGRTGGLVAACLLAGVCSTSEEDDKPSNVVPLPNRNTGAQASPCPPDGPCDEWLKGLQDMYFDVTMGYSNPLDDLTRREFNNSVKRFRQKCPHLADKIDFL